MRPRTRVVPTGLGVRAIVFWMAILGAYFAAPYTNLFFLLITFLTVLAAASVVWTAANLRRLEATIGEIEPAPAESSQALQVIVHRTAGPCHAVTCDLEIDGTRHPILSAVELRPGATERGRVPPLPRGLHRLRGARMVSTWPLGLLRASRPVEAPQELVVFPRPVQLPAARDRDQILAELGGQALTQTGEHGPSGLREYRIGDEPRRIDWKGTARRGSLVVKEHDAHAANGIELSFDRRCTPAQLEDSLSVAAALALWARDNKEPFALHSQGVQATFGPGQRPWRELLAWLAACEAMPSSAPPPPPTGPSVVRLPRRAER